MTRLESVQNAVDQGRSVAARLMGKPKPYNELAWFWSDQGDLKLMIVGLAHGVEQWVVRGDPATRAFSTFGFRDGKLAVVESVNRAGDQAAAKRIIGTTKTDAGRSGRPGVRSAGAGEEVGGQSAWRLSGFCCSRSPSFTPVSPIIEGWSSSQLHGRCIVLRDAPSALLRTRALANPRTSS
jgi:hypothetical protein